MTLAGIESLPGVFGIMRSIHSFSGMTMVEGGGGGDTIGNIATNTLDRDTLVTTTPGPLVTTGPTTQGNGPGADTSEVQHITVKEAESGVGFFTIKCRYQETAPIRFGASATDVRDALTALSLIGFDAGSNPNVDVTKSTDGDGNDTYEIEFQNNLANRDIQPLTPQIVPLLVTGDGGIDVLNVQSIRQDTFFLGGAGEDTVDLNVDVTTGLPLTQNGVNAVISLDGQGAGDNYDINLIGGVTDALVNVIDSGLAGDGSDELRSPAGSAPTSSASTGPRPRTASSATTCSGTAASSPTRSPATTSATTDSKSSASRPTSPPTTSRRSSSPRTTARRWWWRATPPA
jgi:hypothetical protein